MVKPIYDDMGHKADAAVLFVFGQSNAHAHSQFLEESMRLYTPLTHVFSLARQSNQSLIINRVTFEGYKTEGMNLGETQNHTACFAYYTALAWEKAVLSGEELPDLFIVQVSIGSQGIVGGMWNRDKAPALRPGTLHRADIALLPWTEKINHLVMQQLKEQFCHPVVIGCHWIGSENDCVKGCFDHPQLDERYDEHFDRLLGSIGQPCKLYLYEIVLEPDKTADARAPINKALKRQTERLPAVRFVKTDGECPYMNHDPSAHFGIFDRDDVHYLPRTQRWFSDSFLREVWRLPADTPIKR